MGFSAQLLKSGFTRERVLSKAKGVLSCQRLAPGGSWQSRVLDRPSPLADFDPAALLCSLSAAEVALSSNLESSQGKSSVHRSHDASSRRSTAAEGSSDLVVK